MELNARPGLRGTKKRVVTRTISHFLPSVVVSRNAHPSTTLHCICTVSRESSTFAVDHARNATHAVRRSEPSRIKRWHVKPNATRRRIATHRKSVLNEVRHSPTSARGLASPRVCLYVLTSMIGIVFTSHRTFRRLRLSRPACHCLDLCRGSSPTVQSRDIHRQVLNELGACPAATDTQPQPPK